MGTQAVVSVVRNGETLIKCVTGCNGGNAGKLAKSIADRHLVTVESVHDAAAAVYYGCIDSTVTQDKNRMLGDDVENLAGSLYTSKFSDPQFNPRWSYGTAAYVFLVDADTWQITNVPGKKSYGELIRDGELIAIPDPTEGIVFKRPERCSEIEKRSALTLEEATAFVEKWNKGIEESHD